MRIALVVSLILVCGSLSSAAQQRASTLPPGAQSADSALAALCPLQMRVRQGVGGNMVAVDKSGKEVEMFAARLVLLLSNFRPEHRTATHIVAATVTVHGTTARGQVLPADTRHDNSCEIVKRVSVKLAANGEPEVSGDLLLPGFTSTSRVDLESVTYDDGNTWRLSGTDTCHVSPDFIMPVE
jgi:hypothetical protein